MKGSAIPTFGEHILDVSYKNRPGVYAVIFCGSGRIAVVKAPRGYFLPGGAIEPGEAYEDALQREVQEELGRKLGSLRLIGDSVDYFYAPHDQTYYCIQGTFFRAVFVYSREMQSEEDHSLVWLEPEEAIQLLHRKSHAWAVQQAL